MPSFWPWRARPVLDEETLREDLDRIVAFYRDRGYYEAQAEYALEGHGRSVRIEIRVREGEPVRVSEREVVLPEGPWLATEEKGELLAALPLAPGAIFGADPYREAREELLRRLANRGHPAARIEGGAEVDLAARSARVHWQVDPGPPVRFGAVSVEGLLGVEQELVLAELVFRQGDPFSQDALDRSQKKVYELGLFRSVSLQARAPEPVPEGAPVPAEPRQWRVAVRVEERPPRSVRVGVGYGSEDQFRARISWLHRNFLGRARSLELAAKYSSLVAGVEGRVTQRRFLEPLLRLEADASALRETEPSFTANRAGVGLTLIRPILPPWTGRVGYRFELADVTDLDALDPSGAESARLGTLKLALERDTVDDKVAPRSGTHLELRAEPTLGALGSDTDFVTLAAEGRAFLPVGPAVLALRLRLGAIEPVFGSDRSDVPIFKRFFSGGSNSVRGFDYQELGPRDANGEPLGGLTLTESTAELRFPIWRFLEGVTFFDAGQVARGPFAFDPDDLYYSAGPGLRVRTPLGALGLDWGYLLRRPPGVDRWRIHFSVESAF